MPRLLFFLGLGFSFSFLFVDPSTLSILFYSFNFGLVILFKGSKVGMMSGVVIAFLGGPNMLFIDELCFLTNVYLPLPEVYF